MDKIQKIKQEIERLKHSTPNAYDLNRFMLLEEIESFIDSIPEESTSEDLEEEIDRYYSDWQFDDDTIYEDMRDICRHFAEWQKQKDLEDSLKSDMTMPNKFYEKGKADAMKEMKETLQTEYEKGRFDMIEEMLKDAVETTIVNDWQYGKDQDHAIIPAIHQRIEGFNVGDKVKIIIAKTEQQ